MAELSADPGLQDHRREIDEDGVQRRPLQMPLGPMRPRAADAGGTGQRGLPPRRGFRVTGAGFAGVGEPAAAALALSRFATASRTSVSA